MSSTTVHVKNISSETKEQEVRDFFSFCGKISTLSVTPDGSSQSAAVTFEKPTAAKTALLLDNTQLGPSLVQVSTAATLDELAGVQAPLEVGESQEHHGRDVAQEDKPRSRLMAEYLAHGYTISDKAIERAIALDSQHGISSRFTTALQQFDSKFKASEKAQGIDQKYGVSEKAASGWRTMNSYFEHAMGTPSGQKVRDFYTTSSKQVLDVHNEARRLADMNTPKAHPTPVPGDSERTTCTCGGATGKCGCAPGQCACAACAKNRDVPSTADKEAMGMEQVSDNPVRTKCNCGGAEGVCPCEPGKCACGSCAKNPQSATA